MGLTVSPIRPSNKPLPLIFAIVAAVVVSGCTSLAPTQDLKTPVQATQTQLDGTLPLDGSIRQDTTSARVAELWANAEQARLSSNHEAAINFILQAIELQPQDALLLSRVAELQLNVRQPVLAESYAVRSNAYAATNRTMLLRNWLIIEHSREMRGDLLGVRTAHRQVIEFQNPARQ